MYSVYVNIDEFQKRRRSSGLLHLAIGFFLIIKGAEYYKLTRYESFFPVSPVLLTASISLFYGLFRKKLDAGGKQNMIIRIMQIIAYAALALFFFRGESNFDALACLLFSLFCLVLVFTEKKVFSETLIVFHENGISIPGYYKEHSVEWTELTEVVVRQDFITLFHVKQKYLQYQVMQDLSPLETAKMNAFCRSNIEAVQQADQTTNG